MTEPDRPQYPQGSIGAYQRTSGLAIASLVLGIASFFVVPIIGAIAAIVLGKMAQSEIARTPGLEGTGLASAGIILGWIGVALGILGFLLLFAAIAAVGSP